MIPHVIYLDGHFVASHRAPNHLGENGYLLIFDFLLDEKILIFVESENGIKQLIRGKYIIEPSTNDEIFIEIVDIEYSDIVFEKYLDNINCNRIRIPGRIISPSEITVNFFDYNTVSLLCKDNI